MKLLIYSQTSTVALLKFGNGYVFSSQILLGKWLLIHAGIKVNPYRKYKDYVYREMLAQEYLKN